MNVTIFLGVGINIAIIVFYMLKEVIMKIRRYSLKRAKNKLSTKRFFTSNRSERLRKKII